MERYEKYKDSGVEWIGEIPEGWEIKKLKYVVSINDETLPETTNENYELEYVDISNVKSGIGILDTKTYSFDKAPSRARRIVRDGDIIVSTVRTYLKSITIIDNPANNLIVSTGFAVVRPVQVKSSFVGFLFYSEFMIGEIISRSTGVSYPAINASEIGDIFIPIPKNADQTTIANYLDRKTAEIDELIAQKERLLELYEEEKTVIINQAVTKGIDNGKLIIDNEEKIIHSQLSTINYKDSGIDWLGEIPEGWEVKKLKDVGGIRYGLGQPPRQIFGGLPLIRATNIFRGRLDDKNMVFVDPDDIPYDRDPVLKENDIVIVRSGAYTADSAIIPAKYAGAITGYDMVFRTYDNFNPLFISYCLLSNYILEGQLLLHSHRAAQPHLNREELGETLILVPPTLELQIAIVHHIETETARINAKIVKTKRIIELQKEYRTALISEVVTGKIKVTGEEAS